MKKVLAGLVTTAALITPTLASAETLHIACGSLGMERDLCAQGAEAWAKKTGHTVEFTSMSTDVSQELATLQQLMAAGSGDLDVARVDIIWPGLVANHFIDLKPHVPEEVLEQHFPSIVQNNMVNGKLVAMPWYTAPSPTQCRGPPSPAPSTTR